MIPTIQHSGKGILEKALGKEKILGCQGLGGGRDEYSEQGGLQGSETTPYDTVMVDICL